MVACDKNSIEEIQAALRERATKTPDNQWVLGFLYDDGKTPRPLNLHDLDQAVPDHPVLVMHRGGHTVFVNSMALKLPGSMTRRLTLPAAAMNTTAAAT